MIIITITAEKEKNIVSNSKGAVSHTQNTKTNLILGPRKKIILCVLPGEKWVFKNNFTASAIGCKRPLREGLFGPNRLWE